MVIEGFYGSLGPEEPQFVAAATAAAAAAQS